jgi:hypothetical protein
MAYITEPQFDEDLVNKGYFDKTLRTINTNVAKRIQNFGTQPIPPYYVNDTYMNGTDIFICKTERLIGSFNASDWEKASTYTDDTLASTKNKVFNSQPITPYRVGDLWTGGINGELRRCVVQRLTGSYNASDWENATKYDSTSTVVEGGLVTTGTIQVVQGGTVAAGMTGNDSGDTSIRFWAGSSLVNRGSAPFRVTQAGYLYASNANISGIITATSGSFSGTIYAGAGTIAGWTINGTYLSYGGSGGTNGARLYRDGRIYMKSDGGWLNCGDGGGIFNSNSICISDSVGATGTGNANATIGIRALYGHARVASNVAVQIDSSYVYLGGPPGDAQYRVTGDSIIGRGGAILRAYNAVTLEAISGSSVYAVGNGLASSRVLTVLGQSSSRNVKENIVEFTDNEYKEALTLLNDMKLYNYKYKYNLYKDKKQYGFIIDELEELPNVKKYFKFDSAKAIVNGDKLDFAKADDKKDMLKDEEVIEVKSYDSDALDKYLLTVCKALSKKVIELENEIIKLKGGR